MACGERSDPLTRPSGTTSPSGRGEPTKMYVQARSAATQSEADSVSSYSSNSASLPTTDQAPAAEPATQLVEHFFRHESGRLVSVLTRVFGLGNLDLVEDMVQSALVEALQAWRAHGVPDNPSAWMHRVARNKVLDALRQRATLLRIAPAWAQLRPKAPETSIDDLLLDSQIDDSQLRLMFACCHPTLAREPDCADAQVALRLQQRRDRPGTASQRGDRQEEDPALAAAAKRRARRARSPAGRGSRPAPRFRAPVPLSPLQRRIRSLQWR